MVVTTVPNTVVPASTDGRLSLLGVNTAGASFGDVGGRNVIGTSHTYTTHETIDYFASKGMDVIRLDLKWERLQPTLGGSLNETEMQRVDDVVSYAESKGVAVVVSLHNYGKHSDDMIGSAEVPTSAFTDVWSKLASRYADDPNVIFGVMNEPYAHSATQWLPIANAAIDAIRDAGAKQQLLVSGTYWDGAHSWVSSDNDTVIGSGVADPLDNFAFEVHQYLDGDSSGTTPDTVSETIGAERLRAITAWAEQTGNKLFLGEFGAATDPTALKALNNMLAYMTEHSDVWQGGTYWAGGEWWGDYYFAVQPINGQDRPQMNVLDDYVSPQSTPYWKLPALTSELVPAPVPVPVVVPAPTLPAPAAMTLGSGSDTLVLKVSGDAYLGDAQFTVSIDGKQVGGTFAARASHAQGGSESFEFQGDWGVGQHKVSVTFLNDNWGGAPATDRNLHVEAASFNGVDVSGAKLALMANGSRDFAFTDTTAVPTATRSIGAGSETVTLNLSEDAYKGHARFTVSVDGERIGGTLEAGASRGAKQYEALQVKGDWGVGQHVVRVDFLNDDWGGTPATDRNLYVEGASFDGAAIQGVKLDLLSNGSGQFAFNDNTAVSTAATQDMLFA